MEGTPWCLFGSEAGPGSDGLTTGGSGDDGLRAEDMASVDIDDGWRGGRRLVGLYTRVPGIRRLGPSPSSCPSLLLDEERGHQKYGIP